MSGALQQLKGLITGETLRLVKAERNSIEGTRKAIDLKVADLAKLERVNSDNVMHVVRQMVKKPDDNLKVVEELVRDNLPRHKQTPLLMAAIQAKIPVWLHGDSGSGKSTAAELAAEALGLQFRFISVCPTTTESKFLGYCDAGGTYHRTAFRDIYEFGGIFLIDEIDNGNPSILSVLNAALANGHCAFPDGNIKRHENAIILSAANTIGRGADIKYVGRNALDATTLDRFVFVRMDIDENLEGALVGMRWNSNELTDISAGGMVTIEDWVSFVRKVRNKALEMKINCIISPRATLYGQRLIAMGVGRTHLEQMCIWKGMPASDKTKLVQEVYKRA